MNKEELRGKFIKDIPKQIIKGEQLSYADWLEKLIVSKYVVNKNDLLPDVISSFSTDMLQGELENRGFVVIKDGEHFE